ncbi:MAG: PSD1 and planctomycete cytochrome C domain-containing protein [Planctomycetia bacterium]|nr:PSD1 and planctomycete cytochrome C domain-containing protein [Planctomycetia bacterium]
MGCRTSFSLVAAVGLVFVAVACRSASADEAGVEFYEKKVRPILVEHCYECHGPDKQEATLQVDTVGGMLRGGDQGPAIVPGDPDASLLIKGLRYDDVDFQMPPKGKLAAEKIAALEQWVKLGAPAPAVEKRPVAATAKKKFDLAERAKHWCFQPLAKSVVPVTKNAAWPRTEIDRYVLAKLEAAGVAPAVAADKRTLLRRAYFDFVGLPPTIAEVDAFVADDSPEAFEKVVDCLLASPHFGERWGRHWLDLVRYAETRGHEFDYLIPNAYQYRDYVIRSLNADVPYDRFVVEHLAGDLMPEPRMNPKTGANESILATGFWFLGEECHSPVDIRQDETDRVDNKIDVMSKTFLGLTLACARCHDHKFDALSTKDYYALSGFVLGMSYHQAPFEATDHNRRIYDEVKKLEAEYRPKLLAAQAAEMQAVVEKADRYLLAVGAVLTELRKAGKSANRAVSIAAAASLFGVEEARLTHWVDYFETAPFEPGEPLRAWRRMILEGSQSLAGSGPPQPPAADSLVSNEPVLYDPASLPLRDWLVDGVSYGHRPVHPGDLRIGTDPRRPIERLYTASAATRDPKWDFFRITGDTERENTRNRSDQSGRVLKTPTSVLTTGKVWYLVRGSGRVYAAVDSHRINNGPLHGQLMKQFAGADQPTWVLHDLTVYAGHRVHFEFTPLDAGELKEKQSPEFAVLKIVEGLRPPALDVAFSDLDTSKLAAGLKKLDDEAIAKRVADEYVVAFRAALARIAADQLTGPAKSPENGGSATSSDSSIGLAAWMIGHPELWSTSTPAISESVSQFIAKQTELLAKLRRTSHTAPVAWEGSGVNEHVLIRGNHRTTGEVVERRFLEAIDGPDAPPYRSASGRLELAERLLDRRDPLPARVMVNRLWQHLFGRGLVKTVDNFGIMGEAPTHPELLDYLAERYMSEGWSTKKLLRAMALSTTYRMASSPHDSTAAKLATVDPENNLWHRALVKRLEAEAIRDSILAVSGKLDEKQFGPSVELFLTPFMEGRGRPSSGPLDGAGRRSVYLRVRRNFLNPMFQAFDYPTPFTSVGRRANSNVPAQALALMNGEFVRQQAVHWAERSKETGTKDEAARIEQLYQTAFARKPTGEESLAAFEFLMNQRELYNVKSSDDVRAWADLCHVLFNVKEFIYIR